MVGALPQAIAGVALDALAVLVENRHGRGVVGDQVILARERNRAPEDRACRISGSILAT